MAYGLLFDCDTQVAESLFALYKQPVYKFDKCLGIINNKQALVGAVLLHNWNGSNVEISYYGEKTMTPGLIKCLARFIICTFEPSRLTVVVSKRRRKFLRSLIRFGFKLEGSQRCYYGKTDCSRNTGIRLVMFRERLNQLARFELAEAKAKQC